jgi:tRNA1(Val) A37 N6-methylase TrmN6
MMLDLSPPPPHRFVPLDESLSSDAPGYELVDDHQHQQVHNGNDNGGGGPVCWKCHGGGGAAANKPRPPPPPSHDHQTKKKKVCVICHGSGRLPTRQVVPRVGKVTRGRQRQRRPERSAHTTTIFAAAAAPGNPHSPPRPVGYQVPIYGPLVQKATQERVDIMLEDAAAAAAAAAPDHDDDDDQHPSRMMIFPSSSSSLPPIWWPRDNEELCNLVGEYRILQKYKSHRWTTDDLVTAVVAAKTVTSLLLLQHRQHHYQYTEDAAAADATSLVSTSNHHHRRGAAFRYCDLGTGNASVLQMVLYRCHDDIDYAVGVEARREALGLARRSLAFNIVGIGIDDDTAVATAAADAALPPREQDNDINNDSSSLPPPPQKRRRPMVTLIHEDFRNFPLSSTATTPPNNSDHHHSFDLVTGTPPYFAVRSVDATTTIIQQGAMPSSLQSAPARCEFRGGIDEYCQAAVRLLRHNGRFVCCENYANHTRALRAMVEAHLQIERLWYVRGKVGRDRLFVVYVARPRSTDEEDEKDAPTTTIEEHEVSVRDGAGEWTEDYQNDFLRYMDIVD